MNTTPQNWLLLRDAGTPAGVLILSKIPASDTMELVYIGLTPAARGHGYAIRLMLLAISRGSMNRAVEGSPPRSMPKTNRP